MAESNSADASVAAIFAQFDRNGDGLIDRSELKAVLQKLNPELFGTESNIDALLDDIDHDGDGVLSAQEFAQWIEGEGDTPREVRAHVTEEMKKTKRKPCKYGVNCVRRKPQHREAFCHPGDWDWGFDDKVAAIVKEGEDPALKVEDVAPPSNDELKPPQYWQHARDHEPFEEWIEAPPEVTNAMQALIDRSFKEIKTRDRREGNVPKGMEVVGVHRVENSSLWQKYATFRYKSMAKRSHKCTSLINVTGQDLKTEVAGTALDGRLRARANEVYLWHGTSPNGATGIASAGFNLGLAGSGAGSMYGDGVYLAECSSKSDEYAQDDKAGPYRGVFCLLLCRSVLGEVLHMTAGGSATHPMIEAAVKSGSYHSVLGDREASVGTYREFVCYDEGQVYPEYVILYKRDFEGKKREQVPPPMPAAPQNAAPKPAAPAAPPAPAAPAAPRNSAPRPAPAGATGSRQKVGLRDPNEKMTDWMGSEPLGWAASFGELRAVQTLILAGADPLRPPNAAGNTPLQDAEREHHAAVVRFLREYAAKRSNSGQAETGPVLKPRTGSSRFGLIPQFHGRHGGPDRVWILWTIDVADVPSGLELTVEGPPDNMRLRWPQENNCLEVNCRRMEVGNQIFLWNDDPPVPAGHHSTFTLNEDGSLSPSSQCPGKNGGDPRRLALGASGSKVTLVDRNDRGRLLFTIGDRGHGNASNADADQLLSWVRTYAPESGFGCRADQKGAYEWFRGQGWHDRWPLHYAAMVGDCEAIKRLTGLSQGVQPVSHAPKGPAGHYFTFKTGGNPSQVVDRFEVRITGNRWTHFRNGAVGCTARVDSKTARQMESYSFNGSSAGKLLKGPVTGKFEANGDVVWSHGYTSRKE